MSLIPPHRHEEEILSILIHFILKKKKNKIIIFMYIIIYIKCDTRYKKHNNLQLCTTTDCNNIQSNQFSIEHYSISESRRKLSFFGFFILDNLKYTQSMNSSKILYNFVRFYVWW